jgi:hypothetical protein
MGEGYHNYHHAFPWDCKLSEHCNFFLNPSIVIVEFFSLIGWASELKTASAEMVKQRMMRTGLESRDNSKMNNKEKGLKASAEHSDGINVWGWEDEAMNAEDKKLVNIVSRSKLN